MAETVASGFYGITAWARWTIPVNELEAKTGGDPIGTTNTTREADSMYGQSFSHNLQVDNGAGLVDAVPDTVTCWLQISEDVAGYGGGTTTFQVPLDIHAKQRDDAAEGFFQITTDITDLYLQFCGTRDATSETIKKLLISQAANEFGSLVDVDIEAMTLIVAVTAYGTTANIGTGGSPGTPASTSTSGGSFHGGISS